MAVRMLSCADIFIMGSPQTVRMTGLHLYDLGSLSMLQIASNIELISTGDPDNVGISILISALLVTSNTITTCLSLAMTLLVVMVIAIMSSSPSPSTSSALLNLFRAAPALPHPPLRTGAAHPHLGSSELAILLAQLRISSPRNTDPVTLLSYLAKCSNARSR